MQKREAVGHGWLNAVCRAQAATAAGNMTVEAGWASARHSPQSSNMQPTPNPHAASCLCACLSLVAFPMVTGWVQVVAVAAAHVGWVCVWSGGSRERLINHDGMAAAGGGGGRAVTAPPCAIARQSTARTSRCACGPRDVAARLTCTVPAAVGHRCSPLRLWCTQIKCGTLGGPVAEDAGCQGGRATPVASTARRSGRRRAAPIADR